jgi:hypothetical protein
MITEINNSFREKKNAFFRLEKDGSPIEKAERCEIVATLTPESNPSVPPILTVSSVPKAKIYRGSWKKNFFLSPYEKVEGAIALKFHDLLSPMPNKDGPLNSHATLLTPDGKAKVTTRLSSWGPPVDPLAASSWELFSFLLVWSAVGALSEMRIYKEALRIRWRGKMKYLKHPETHPQNVPRPESDIERYICSFFKLSSQNADYPG